MTTMKKIPMCFKCEHVPVISRQTRLLLEVTEEVTDVMICTDKKAMPYIWLGGEDVETSVNRLLVNGLFHVDRLTEGAALYIYNSCRNKEFTVTISYFESEE